MSAAGFLVDNYVLELREVMRETIRTGREHGFQVTGEVGQTPPVATIRSGQVGSIAIPNMPPRAPLGIEVHSHPPPGSVGLSEKDWENVGADFLQYPPVYDYPEGALRGFVVVSQRLGEPEKDVFTVHAVQVTREGLEMGLTEQRELAKELFTLLRGERDRTVLNPSDEVRDILGDRITEQFETIPLSPSGEGSAADG